MMMNAMMINAVKTQMKINPLKRRRVVIRKEQLEKQVPLDNKNASNNDDYLLSEYFN